MGMGRENLEKERDSRSLSVSLGEEFVVEDFLGRRKFSQPGEESISLHSGVCSFRLAQGYRQGEVLEAALGFLLSKLLGEESFALRLGD